MRGIRRGQAGGSRRKEKKWDEDRGCRSDKAIYDGNPNVSSTLLLAGLVVQLCGS